MNATGQEIIVNDDFLNNLDAALSTTEIGDPTDDAPPKTTIGSLRRRGKFVVDRVRAASLVEIDGVLTWEPGLLGSRPLSGAQSPLRRGARRGIFGPSPAQVIKQVRFEELERSQVFSLLDRVDDRLTPRDSQTGERGLKKLHGEKIVTTAKLPDSGRLLLLIHGTFSNSKNLVQSFQETLEGREFLALAERQYPGGVFAFDHATLAATPLENAVDLARLFENSQAQVDVIAHSRGGLVARWWFEVLSPNSNLRGKAVLVGSPLAGTSLAAPPQWRSLMDYLTNLSGVLGAGAGAISFALPCMTVATALLKIFGSMTNFAARSPLADAAVALVPGLNGQSRVGNVPGLLQLRRGNARVDDRYHAIVSNFEPDPIGWKFWRVFNRPIERMANFAADALFTGPNDLVVDVESMSDLRPKIRIPASRLLDFGTNANIHHTNYFAEPKVWEKLKKWLFADPT